MQSTFNGFFSQLGLSSQARVSLTSKARNLIKPPRALFRCKDPEGDLGD